MINIYNIKKYAKYYYIFELKNFLLIDIKFFALQLLIIKCYCLYYKPFGLFETIVVI